MSDYFEALRCGNQDCTVNAPELRAGELANWTVSCIETKQFWSLH